MKKAATKWAPRAHGSQARLGDRGDPVAVVWDEPDCATPGALTIGWLLYLSRLPSEHYTGPAHGPEVGELGRARADRALASMGVELG